MDKKRLKFLLLGLGILVSMGFLLMVGIALSAPAEFIILTAKRTPEAVTIVEKEA